MTDITISNSTQVTHRGPCDDDVLLNGQPIESCSAELHAWTDPDHLAFAHRHQDYTLPGSTDAGLDVCEHASPAIDHTSSDDDPIILAVPAADLAAAATRLRPDP